MITFGHNFLPRHRDILLFVGTHLLNKCILPGIAEISVACKTCEPTARDTLKELTYMGFLYEYQLGKKHIWLTRKGQKFVHKFAGKIAA